MVLPSMNHRLKLQWGIFIGLVIFGVVFKCSSQGTVQEIDPSAPRVAGVIAISTDANGVPVAPFQLDQPPPVLELTPEQQQLLRQYNSVRRNAHGGTKYKLACSYSRSGDVGAAIYWLQRAAKEDGVDPGWAARDPDLALVRADKRGPTLFSYLDRMAEYYEHHPLDRQILSLPKSYRVGRPIPMLIGLHGFGSVPEDFSGDFELMADALGMALLAVSATITRGPESFAWREDVLADTSRIERAIAAVSEQVTVTSGQIYLIGFSQGGQLALEIAARQPERFRGAIAMSPGTVSSMERIAFADSKLSGRRFVIVVGQKEHARVLATAQNSNERLLQFGAQVYYHVYPGVSMHAFPPDYSEVLPKWLSFLAGGEPPT
ncbi:MAG TPA: alpha/beta fold hydrolase [Polyangiaceae bacterium]|nr:alpha/beta fold hydrolase [Polyangiaceae bacterium]